MLFLPPAGHRDSAAHPPPGPGNCGWALRLRSTVHLRGHPHLSGWFQAAAPGSDSDGATALPPARRSAVRTPALLRNAKDSVWNDPLTW